MALHLKYMCLTRQILHQHFKALTLLGSAYTQTSFLLQMVQEQKNKIFKKAGRQKKPSLAQAQLPKTHALQALADAGKET